MGAKERLTRVCFKWMKHLDLFSGIGGFSLACQWVGIETIGFVEIDKYCQKILKKHWPNVPIVEDIRDVEKIKEIVANATESEGSVDRIVISNSKQGQSRRSGGEGIMGSQPRGEHRLGIGKQVEPQPTILITAGFPCQPFSVAGKRQGERDDRYLWPETLTVIEAIKPQWILLENVPGIIDLALDTVLSDLESAGYSTETLIIPACAVNAWHRRDRIWIVGYAKGNGQRPSRDNVSYQIQQKNGENFLKVRCRQVPIAHSKGTRTWQDNGGVRQRTSGIDRGQESIITGSRLLRQAKRQKQTTGTAQCDWWSVEPELGRVAHGIPRRVDRLKCLGNAIVPQVAYEILKAIKEFDKSDAKSIE